MKGKKPRKNLTIINKLQSASLTKDRLSDEDFGSERDDELTLKGKTIY